VRKRVFTLQPGPPHCWNTLLLSEGLAPQGGRTLSARVCSKFLDHMSRDISYREVRPGTQVWAISPGQLGTCSLAGMHRRAMESLRLDTRSWGHQSAECRVPPGRGPKGMRA